MAETDVFKWAVDQGAMASLLLIGAYFYRRDILNRESQYNVLWDTMHSALQKQQDTMLRVVVENTASNAHVAKTVDALHRRLDRDEQQRGYHNTPAV